MGVMGEPADMIGWNRRLQRVMFEQVKTAPDSASLHRQLSRVITVALPLLPESRQGQVNAQNLAGQVDMMTTRWFRSFVSSDPAPTLRKLRCPVLALTGEKDLQVLPEEKKKKRVRLFQPIPVVTPGLCRPLPLPLTFLLPRREENIQSR
mgnify:CR=1 FL=1